MSNSNITGRLKNAYPEDHGTCWIIWGKVYDDAKKRFPDGTPVHTSWIVSLEDGIAITRNSIYEIESWASPADEEMAKEFASRKWDVLA